MRRSPASVARRHVEQVALERIELLSHAGLDVAGFLNEVNPVISRVVPNGTDTIDSPFWYTLDPQSHLITSIYGQGCDIDPGDYMQWELFAEDFMKTADVLHNPRGVQTLHGVTDGQPERSTIYREVMVPHGMSQELLVALRTSSGESWGTARLNRTEGDPMFSEQEIGFLSATSPLIAAGVQRGLLVGEATDPEYADAPGLIVMTPEGHPQSLSPSADEWLSRLPNDHGRTGGLPTSVLAVAAALRNAEVGGDHDRSVRVPTTDGRWALVHGTVMEEAAGASVIVIIEAAHPERIAPLLMSIYGLTGREREVTKRVLRGGSTSELAADLNMSPHTVQQHLKSIFEKTGVRSRGELVAKVYFDCYAERVADNRDRIRSERFIRGGPRRVG